MDPHETLRYRELRERNGIDYFSRLLFRDCETMNKHELLEILFRINLNYDLDQMKIRDKFRPCVNTLIENNKVDKNTCNCLNTFIMYFGTASNYHYK